MDAFTFLVAALAVWRLAHLLHSEDGPWRLIARLRAAAAMARIGLFDCFLCVSVWPALPTAFLLGGDGLRNWRFELLGWPALSALAILIERAAFPDTFVDPPPFFEESET